MKLEGFEFLNELELSPCGHYRAAEILGEIPLPKLEANDRMILPIGEGMVFTIKDEYTFLEDPEADERFEKIVCRFCGKTATVSMLNFERNGKFLSVVLKNGAYATYTLDRTGGRYIITAETKEPTKVYYGIFDSLNEVCSAYRDIKDIKYVTLAQKMKALPEIEKLLGGAIFWVWDERHGEVLYSKENNDTTALANEYMLKTAEEIHSLGVDKAMFGIFYKDDSVAVEELYKKYGYISSQYDNYSDVFNPSYIGKVPTNRLRTCDYTARRMKDNPDGILYTAPDTEGVAWELLGFDGNYYPMKPLCPAVAVQRIREEVPEIIREYPYYKARFLDVWGGGVRDCYNPLHPITREECKKIKADGLSALMDMGLLSGTEDGFEDIVDSLVYSEGMHSPDFLRYDNSGRRYPFIQEDWERKSTMNIMCDPKNRVPLFEMIYHDALIPFPYWGDAVNACPEAVHKKVMYACLYGCAPLYSFQYKDFELLKDSIIDSYKEISAVHKKVALLPMTSFDYLSDDYQIQTTLFGDKYRVVANFSQNDFEFEGKTVPANDYIFIEY